MTCPECGSSNFTLYSKKIQNREAVYSVELCSDCGYIKDSLAVKELSEDEVAKILHACRSFCGLTEVFQK